MSIAAWREEERRSALRRLGVRSSYRTWRVLGAISDLTSVCAGPGPSNREVAVAAGIEDEGQASKLLKRLEGLGLVENTGVGHAKGQANAWALTVQGKEALRELEDRFG
jgi:hypothetical protein